MTLKNRQAMIIHPKMAPYHEGISITVLGLSILRVAIEHHEKSCCFLRSSLCPQWVQTFAFRPTMRGHRIVGGPPIVQVTFHSVTCHPATCHPVNTHLRICTNWRLCPFLSLIRNLLFRFAKRIRVQNLRKMASNTRAKVKDLTATKKSNRETFRRRKLNFLKRGNDISAAFQADVYILISWNGKFFTYKSTDRPSWPPAEDELVCI